MDNVLIPLLTDMAISGRKVDKSFIMQTFMEPAYLVNNRFPNASMIVDNVENYMHTLNLNHIGWNDMEKMLVLEEETYHTDVEVYVLY